MPSESFGGDLYCSAGEIPLTGGSTPIPLPLSVFGPARLVVTAPSGEDVYIGPLGQVFHRIPANTAQWFTVRPQLYVSASPQSGPASSSSSSSSISAVNSVTYFYQWS